MQDGHGVPCPYETKGEERSLDYARDDKGAERSLDYARDDKGRRRGPSTTLGMTSWGSG